MSEANDPREAADRAEAAHGAETDDEGWRQTWHGVHEAVSGKWALHVLRLLSEGDRGFNEMRRSLGGATAKTLSRRLDELRCAGFVAREVRPTSPPSTRYSLTPEGETFVSLLRRMEPLVEVVDCPDCEGCSTASVSPERTRECAVDC